METSMNFNINTDGIASDTICYIEDCLNEQMPTDYNILDIDKETKKNMFFTIIEEMKKEVEELIEHEIL